MAANLSVVAFDAVRRLQLYREQHPGVLIELRTVPQWHWCAWPVAGREVVNHDLGLLLDELSALTHPAPHHPAQPGGSAARPADTPLGGRS